MDAKTEFNEYSTGQIWDNLSMKNNDGNGV